MSTPSLKPLTLAFDPNVIEHLGVRMYSSLPPVLSELIANAYDADADKVSIVLRDNNGDKKIIVSDDGDGMTYKELQDKFLTIGRNRRNEEKPLTSKNRKPIGKKGLGKLAFFGIVKTVFIETVKNGMKTAFSMNWDSIKSSAGTYTVNDIAIEPTSEQAGTRIILSDIQRKSPFNAMNLAISISRYFLFDADFGVTVRHNNNALIIINEKLRHKGLQQQFTWNIPGDIKDDEVQEYFAEHGIEGAIITTEKPIPARQDMRGITVFSRTKLVQRPYVFSNNISSNFYSYLTGSLRIDMIDEIAEDVIATHRRDIDWEHDETSIMHEKINSCIKQIASEWREKRKSAKKDDASKKTGNLDKWINALEDESVARPVKKIIEVAQDDDGDSAEIIKNLHELVPEYPLLHWRYLHPKIQGCVEGRYKQGDYFIAAWNAINFYIGRVQQLSGLNDTGYNLMDGAFGKEQHKRLHITDIHISRADKSKAHIESCENIEEGQRHLSVGLVQGFRNPSAHLPTDEAEKIFSKKDCLDILGLVSYLLYKAEAAKKRESKK